MKQINVHDETHLAVQELSTTAGLSMLRIVDEAVRLYKDHLEGKKRDNALVNIFLARVGDMVTERLTNTMRAKIYEAIVEITDEVIERQQAENAKYEKELAEAIQIEEADVRNPNKPWLGREAPIAEDEET